MCPGALLTQFFEMAYGEQNTLEQLCAMRIQRHENDSSRAGIFGLSLSILGLKNHARNPSCDHYWKAQTTSVSHRDPVAEEVLHQCLPGWGRASGRPGNPRGLLGTVSAARKSTHRTNAHAQIFTLPRLADAIPRRATHFPRRKGSWWTRGALAP